MLTARFHGNMACQSSANEICGGGIRLNAYKHAVVTAPSSSSSATSSFATVSSSSSSRIFTVSKSQCSSSSTSNTVKPTSSSIKTIYSVVKSSSDVKACHVLLPFVLGLVQVGPACFPPLPFLLSFLVSVVMELGSVQWGGVGVLP